MIRSSRSESGVTLVELVVSMLVLTVALLIANGLLLEAVRIFSASGRELREPASELALFIEGCELVGRRTLSPGIVKPKILAVDRAV